MRVGFDVGVNGRAGFSDDGSGCKVARAAFPGLVAEQETVYCIRDFVMRNDDHFRCTTSSLLPFTCTEYEDFSLAVTAC